MSEPAPDPRYAEHAANERTMLAWIRTGLALMTFGFAIARFGFFLREVAQVEHAAPQGHIGSEWVGVALVMLGLISNALATVRYARMHRAIEERRPLEPKPAMVYAMGIASVVVALAMAVLLTHAMAG